MLCNAFVEFMSPETTLHVHQPRLNFNLLTSKHKMVRQRARIHHHHHYYQASFRNTPKLPKNKAPLLLPCRCRCSAQGFQLGGDGDRRALETVLKLYSAIKNNNFNQLSDIIGEECLCICNFASTFQSFHGKEQVLAFFSSLVKNLGNNIEFIVQPSFHDGFNVGISWRLEWSKNHVPLGKGFSFYMCHIYQGKMVIKNVDMFLEPILHIEPLRLKTVTFLTSAVDDICSRALLKGKSKEVVKTVFPLILMAALFFFLRHLFRDVCSSGVKKYWYR